MDLNSESYNINIDPSSFDASVTSLLICLGGEKYIDIFRGRNISQETLIELSDDDLMRLGVDDPDVRAGLMREVKNFPVYEQIILKRKMISDLDLAEVSTLLRDTNQHMHRIYLSMISINLVLRRANMRDDVIADKPVTTILKTTLNELTDNLNKMDYALQKKFKCLTSDYIEKAKKIAVGTVGSAAIAVLAVFFVRSLKHAKYI